MHSVVDWFAFAIWNPAGELQRSLSLSPDSGILENIGSALPPAAPYWSGEFDEDGEDGHRTLGAADRCLPDFRPR